mmetsp:Transcript_9363/g.34347  ORF Transcript_9363/g.34347 Transcript_9363/m.34347 type:complete len:968 (-) Transcript_9363:165-3068(-)|eukprot:scaffold1624_cov403-Prasinococcus_capsulatus_cf.AAC.4
MTDTEAFLQFCEVDLQVEPALKGKAQACLAKLQAQAPTDSNKNSAALGAKTIDKKRVLYGCCVYMAKKLAQKENEAVLTGPNLSKILTAARVSLVDFLTEMRNCITCPGLMPDDSENGFETVLELRTQSLNMVFLSVLSNKYEGLLKNFFVESSQLSHARKLGWFLFILAYTRLLPRTRDLVTCFRVLLDVVAMLMVHAPSTMRKINFNDKPFTNYERKEDGKVIPFEALCGMYKAEYGDETISKYVEALNELLKSTLPDLQQKVAPEAESGNLHESVFYLEGLLGPNVDANVDALDRAYEASALGAAEIDARLFLTDKVGLGDISALSPVRNAHESLQPNLSRLSHGDENVNNTLPSPLRHMNGAKFPGSPMPMSPLSSPQVSGKAGPPSSPGPLLATSVPPRTPVSQAMAGLNWLRNVLARMPQQPTKELQDKLNKMNASLLPAIEERVNKAALEIFPAAEELSTDGTHDRAIEAASLACVNSNQQRRKEATKLYFKVFESILTAEMSSKGDSLAVQKLCSNEHFHKALIACSFDIILEIYKLSGMRFPELIRKLDLPAFEVTKVIETFVRNEDSLPKNLKQHMNAVDESIVDSLAWQPESSLYPALREAIAYRELAAKKRQAADGEDGKTDAMDTSEEKGQTLQSATRTVPPEEEPVPAEYGEVDAEHTALAKECPAISAISYFFERKVLKLAVIRLAVLCERLRLHHMIQPVYTVIKHALYNCTSLFYNRHLDQLILSAIYGVCKVKQVPVTFRDIIYQYRKLPQQRQEIFRSVVLEQTNPGMKVSRRGDIIEFYNKVFIPSMKTFLLKLGNNKPQNSEESPGADESKLHPLPRLPVCSPKKVSNQHNVYVSQLRSDKASELMSPRTKSLYAFLGESTHAYQSPSKDLSFINGRINQRPRSALDLGDEINHSSVTAAVEAAAQYSAPKTSSDTTRTPNKSVATSLATKLGEEGGLGGTKRGRT